MSNNKQTTEYKYPVGDFLSGFSEDQNNPCDYELECQRMVIRGVQYLDEHPKLVKKIADEKLDVGDEALNEMTDFMIKGQDGQTATMIVGSIQHAYYAKKVGWDNYIKTITEKSDDNQ